MSYREKAGFLWVALAALGVAAPAGAEDIPDLTLRYRELTGREELKFLSKGEASTKPAGMLNWEFPPAAFATIGFETAPTTYCLEPLVPVFPGVEYPFRVETFGQPRDFHLKDDEAGRKAAERRTKFVRELYGRYYAESTKDATASAAFQTAVWELIGETDVPEGPMPYSLYSGTFKADYTNEAASPVFVRTAQKYVQSLTGDDTAFTDSAALAPFELVRLTGMSTTAGPLAQSQLALRLRAGSANIVGPFGDSAAGATGGSGGGLAGLLGSRPAFGGFGGGGGGFGGGGGGAPFFGSGLTSTNPNGSTSTNPNTNPQNPNVVVPPGPTNPQNPNTPDTPNNPVPAPPAVVLGLIALAAFGGRKVLARTRKAE